MKLKLLNNEIYRDILVSLINIECRMLLGLDSEDVQNVLSKILKKFRMEQGKKEVLTI